MAKLLLKDNSAHGILKIKFMLAYTDFTIRCSPDWKIFVFQYNMQLTHVLILFSFLFDVFLGQHIVLTLEQHFNPKL